MGRPNFSRCIHQRLTIDYNAVAMSQQSESASALPKTVAIVGVGLIGGSIAAAVKARGAAGHVIGVGRNKARLEIARDRGWLDCISTDVAAAKDADFIIFCTPVDRIVSGVREIAAICRPGTLITDAGSVKGIICDELAEGLPADVEFIGSHPLAGSEKQGCEFADPQLLEGRVCVVTPVETTTRMARDRARSFWKSLGATVRELTPAAHDRALAETSHLPHLAAATLAATLSFENRPFAASGFRDTTRIASGDPDLWTAILLSNADDVLHAFQKQEQIAERFRQALETRDAAKLRNLLNAAKSNRDALNHSWITTEDTN